MAGLHCLCLLLAVSCVLDQTNAAPHPSETVFNNYMALSGRPCMQECQTKCGGICYLNMMTFKHTCSCTRFGK